MSNLTQDQVWLLRKNRDLSPTSLNILKAIDKGIYDILDYMKAGWPMQGLMQRPTGADMKRLRALLKSGDPEFVEAANKYIKEGYYSDQAWNRTVRGLIQRRLVDYEPGTFYDPRAFITHEGKAFLLALEGKRYDSPVPLQIYNVGENMPPDKNSGRNPFFDTFMKGYSG